MRRSCYISLYYNASSWLPHVQENLSSFKVESTKLKPDLNSKILSKACCQQYIGASTTLTSEARDPHVQSCNWNPSGKSLGQRICLSYTGNPKAMKRSLLKFCIKSKKLNQKKRKIRREVADFRFPKATSSSL